MNFRRSFSVVLMSLTVFVFSIRSQATLSDVPTPWSNFTFVNYTYGGNAITDNESSSDPSHGPAAVQPAEVDIASCSGNGSTPGSAPSAQISYFDADSNPATLNDIYVGFRLRLNADPLESGQQKGYRSAHWNVLIDIDNDGFKEFVIDMDGSVNSQQPDRVYLLYNNSPTQEVNGRSGSARQASDVVGGDELDLWYASGPGATGASQTNNHTRVVKDTSISCTGSNDYYLDTQIPLIAFNVGGTQLITPTSPVRLFYSTSASATNPLQKDWMMDPAGLSSTFDVTDPIVFGDIYSGTGGVQALPTTDLAISKLHTGNFSAGSTGTYTLSVSNTGTQSVSGPITVTDTLPAGLSFGSGSGTGWSCNFVGQIVTCTNPGSIGIGQNSIITLLVNVGSAAVPSVTNTVSVGVSGDGDSTNNTASDPTTVNANQPPTANNDGSTTTTNTAVSIPVLVNDSDPDSDPLTVTGATNGASGTVSFSPNGTVIYTPNAGFTGTDTFTYTISDGNGNSSTATVTVTVDNAAPQASPDTSATPANTAVSIPVLANDSDPNGDTLTVTGATNGASGTVSFSPDGTVIYTPNAGFTGTDSFTYTISDGHGNTATTTVTVTVSNSEPNAVADSASTPTNTAVAIPVLANDTDPNGDPLSVVAVSQGAHGTVTSNADGTVIYTPNAGFSGTDTFTYTISDGKGGTATTTVTVTVNNGTPNAAADSAATQVDTSVTIPVLTNDSDPNGDTLTVIGVSQPANGTVVLNPDGTVTYTPDTGYAGDDTFTYIISDGQGGISTAIAAVSVAVNNNTPNAVADRASTDSGTPVTIPVLTNDSDPNNDPLSVIAISQPAHGTATLNPDGTVTYTPDPGFSGTDSFTYTISDGRGGVITSTVTIDVLPGMAVTGGDPPIWGNIMAFPTPEKALGEDLNGNGIIGDTVLRYQYLTTGEIVNTGLEVSNRHRDVDLYEGTIVFMEETRYPAGVIYTYNVKTGEVRSTGVLGFRPTIYGDILSVSGNTIRYVKLEQGRLTETGIPGESQAIWGNLIAYHHAAHPAFHPTIRYYNIATGEVVNTKVAGMFPAMWENTIAFTTEERLINQDLNGDGDMLDAVIRYYDIATGTVHNTGQAGKYPAVYGRHIAFITSGHEVAYYDIEQGQAYTTGRLGTEPDLFEDTISYYLWEEWAIADLNGDGDRLDPIVRTFQITDEVTALQTQNHTEEQQEVPLNLLKAFSAPNPAQTGKLITFTAQGTGIQGLNVDIYDLAGRRVFESGFVNGNTLFWNQTNYHGQLVANGVYLYIVTVQGKPGDTQRSPVKKLVVLR